MKDCISVYIVVASAAEAESIAEALVHEKLAACVNILPAMRSVYRWQGRVEAASETALIAKSRHDLFARLQARVKSLTSIACPCIVAWPIIDGHRPYLDWLQKETSN